MTGSMVTGLSILPAWFLRTHRYSTLNNCGINDAVEMIFAISIILQLSYSSTNHVTRIPKKSKYLDFSSETNSMLLPFNMMNFERF
jgi:hypothetical protein